MLLTVDAASDRSIYAQIADSVRRAIARNELRAGEKLPPANEVAQGLGVNKHTVLHAYQDLRDEGLVDLRRGRGAVVTPLAGELSGLHRDAARIAERARALGISAQTLAAIFEDEPPRAAGSIDGGVGGADGPRVAGGAEWPDREPGTDARSFAPSFVETSISSTPEGAVTA